jgi:hypothetical protein
MLGSKSDLIPSSAALTKGKKKKLKTTNLLIEILNVKNIKPLIKRASKLVMKRAY